MKKIAHDKSFQIADLFNKLQHYLTVTFTEIQQCREVYLKEIDSLSMSLDKKSIAKSYNAIAAELERRKEFDDKFDSIVQTLDKLGITET